MRLILVCSCLAAAAVVGACSGGDAQDGATHSGGRGGGGGTTGGTAAGGAGGAGKAGGNGAGGSAGSAGTNATGGSGGVAGTGGHGGTTAVGGGGAGGSATGGANDQGGAQSAAGDSAGGDGSAGSPADCGAATTNKVIFVSSALYTGAIGGLTGADSKCQALATAAGLCGTYKAWLSDNTGNAADRLTHATGAYVLTTGEVVASDWFGLRSGSLQHAINQTEKKTAAPVGTVTCGGSSIAPVWTGATFSGIAVGNGSCNDWSNASVSGTIGAAYGNANATNFAWSGACQLNGVCPSTAALYCVEQ